MPLKVTPNPKHCREKFVVDIYSSEGNHNISCIDIFSQIASLEQIKTKDWIECIELLKADRDRAFFSLALKRWLKEESNYSLIQNGVADNQ